MQAHKKRSRAEEELEQKTPQTKKLQANERRLETEIVREWLQAACRILRDLKAVDSLQPLIYFTRAAIDLAHAVRAFKEAEASKKTLTYCITGKPRAGKSFMINHILRPFQLGAYPATQDQRHDQLDLPALSSSSASAVTQVSCRFLKSSGSGTVYVKVVKNRTAPGQPDLVEEEIFPPPGQNPSSDLMQEFQNANKAMELYLKRNGAWRREVRRFDYYGPFGIPDHHRVIDLPGVGSSSDNSIDPDAESNRNANLAEADVVIPTGINGRLEEILLDPTETVLEPLVPTGDKGKSLPQILLLCNVRNDCTDDSKLIELLEETASESGPIRYPTIQAAEEILTERMKHTLSIMNARDNAEDMESLDAQARKQNRPVFSQLRGDTRMRFFSQLAKSLGSLLFLTENSERLIRQNIPKFLQNHQESKNPGQTTFSIRWNGVMHDCERKKEHELLSGVFVTLRSVIVNLKQLTKAPRKSAKVESTSPPIKDSSKLDRIISKVMDTRFDWGSAVLNAELAAVSTLEKEKMQRAIQSWPRTASKSAVGMDSKEDLVEFFVQSEQFDGMFSEWVARLVDYQLQDAANALFVAAELMKESNAHLSAPPAQDSSAVDGEGDVDMRQCESKTESSGDEDLLAAIEEFSLDAGRFVEQQQAGDADAADEESVEGKSAESRGGHDERFLQNVYQELKETAKDLEQRLLMNDGFKDLMKQLTRQQIDRLDKNNVNFAIQAFEAARNPRTDVEPVVHTLFCLLQQAFLALEGTVEQKLDDLAASLVTASDLMNVVRSSLAPTPTSPQSAQEVAKQRLKSLENNLARSIEATSSELLKSTSARHYFEEKVNLMDRPEFVAVQRRAYSALPRGSGALPNFVTNWRLQTHSEQDKWILLRIVDSDEGHRVEIEAYRDWQEDLQQCLISRTRRAHNQKAAAPIFIPSLGRYDYGKTRNVFRGLRETLEMDFYENSLVYLVVEQQEAKEYSKLIREYHLSENVVLVKLPGVQRGIRFARSCILLLQAVMRQIYRPKGSFDIFHTVDDDFSQVRRFNPQAFDKDCMEPCTLYLALKGAEQVIEHECRKRDARIKLFDASSEVDTALGRLEKLLMERADEMEKLGLPKPMLSSAILKLQENKHEVIALADNQKLHRKLKEMYHIEDTHPFAKEFFAILDSLKTVSFCMVALTKDYITRLSNYNFAFHRLAQPEKPSESDCCFQYRVSQDVSGCVSHYAPAYQGSEPNPVDGNSGELSLYNYLDTAQFFRPQLEVAKQRAMAAINSEAAREFTDDHDFLVRVMRNAGKGAFCICKFDIKFERNTMGGKRMYPAVAISKKKNKQIEPLAASAQ